MCSMYLRKCAICDSGKKTKSIDIKKNDFVKEGNKCYHINCFIHKENSKKKNILSEAELFNKIEILKMETDKWKNEIKYKNDLFEWIYDNYDIHVLPNWIIIKINNINNGSYKGLKDGIPYEDILIIFKKMKNYMDKTAFEKTSKGQGFKNQSDRVSYDLAIVVNNYDKYKKWKENQNKLQIEEKVIEKQMEEKKMYNNISKKTNKNNDSINVAELIDELF